MMYVGDHPSNLCRFVCSDRVMVTDLSHSSRSLSDGLSVICMIVWAALSSFSWNLMMVGLSERVSSTSGLIFFGFGVPFGVLGRSGMWMIAVIGSWSERPVHWVPPTIMCGSAIPA